MKAYTDTEKKRYKWIAALVARRHKDHLDELNLSAKLALDAVREGLPEGAGDEMVLSFMSSICYLMARLMAANLDDAAMMIRKIFDDYTIGIASLLGQYDLTAVDDSAEMDEMHRMWDQFTREREREWAEREASDNYLGQGRPSPYL